MKRSRFTVIYDACVLYPAPLRDLLMWLASAGRFQARWSAQIRAEWQRSLLENRPDLHPDRVVRTASLMERAIPEALVTDYEDVIVDLELPDPDDRHVLAAAIHCGAEMIVTFNEKDFPASVLEIYGVETRHPDAFVVELFEIDPTTVLSAARRQRTQLSKPSIPAEQYLDILHRQGLVRTAQALAEFRSVI